MPSLHFGPGTAFYFTDGEVARRSLWAVIAGLGEASGSVLMVPFDIIADRVGDVCVADSHDHPHFWAGHFANFSRAREVAVPELQRAFDLGALVPLEPLSVEFLVRIMGAAGQSRMLKNRFRDALDQQGLID